MSVAKVGVRLSGSASCPSYCLWNKYSETERIQVIWGTGRNPLLGLEPGKGDSDCLSVMCFAFQHPSIIPFLGIIYSQAVFLSPCCTQIVVCNGWFSWVRFPTTALPTWQTSPDWLLNPNSARQRGHGDGHQGRGGKGRERFTSALPLWHPLPSSSS